MPAGRGGPFAGRRRTDVGDDAVIEQFVRVADELGWDQESRLAHLEELYRVLGRDPDGADTTHTVAPDAPGRRGQRLERLLAALPGRHRAGAVNRYLHDRVREAEHQRWFERLAERSANGDAGPGAPDARPRRWWRRPSRVA